MLIIAIILILKLIELYLYANLAIGYPNIVTYVDTSSCIEVSVLSVIIFIIIYFYINKKAKGNKLIYLSVILTIFATIMTIIIVTTYFPLNVITSRAIGFLLSIISCIFCIYKTTHECKKVELKQ